LFIIHIWENESFFTFLYHHSWCKFLYIVPFWKLVHFSHVIKFEGMKSFSGPPCPWD
jgi:hypothetical protein